MGEVMQKVRDIIKKEATKENIALEINAAMESAKEIIDNYTKSLTTKKKMSIEKERLTVNSNPT